MTKNCPRLLRLLAGYGVLYVINGCFFTWSILSPYFADFAPHWTAAQLAAPATVNIAVSALGGLSAPRFLKRFSPRAVTRISGVIMSLGWLIMLLLQWMPSVCWLCLGYAFIGFGSGVYYPVIGKVLTAWYPERSGAVSGGLLFATGLGTVTVAVLERVIISAHGILRFCLLAAAVYLLVLWIGGHWMVMPAGQEQPPASSTSRDSAAVRRAARTPLFWIFFLWLVLLASSGLLIINNAGMIFSYYHAPAAVGMFSMVATGIGCLLMGIAIDRFGLYRSMLAACLFSLFACALLLAGHWGGLTPLILLGTLLSGVAYGTTTSSKMAGALRLYGSEHMTDFFGVFNLNIVPASFLGPYISGWFLTLGRGHIYSFGFITILNILALFSVLTGRRPLRAERR